MREKRDSEPEKPAIRVELPVRPLPEVRRTKCLIVVSYRKIFGGK